MNARMLTKMAVVFGVFFALVAIGVKAGRYADKAASQTSNRMATAFSILEKN